MIRTLFLLIALSTLSLRAALPEEMLSIMHQSKYQHANWGIYVKDSQTGQILYDHRSDQLMLPASTTKLFSVAALLHAYGDDYRFKTPIYASGTIQKGQLKGSLILVAQGDLTLGGRQDDTDKIAYTKLDHVNANFVPGTTLTKEDPLHGIRELAKQVRKSGIQEIQGNVLIDDRLFDISEERGISLSPIMINENLIDIVLNPTSLGQETVLTWRPQVEGYSVKNGVKTIAKGGIADIQISSDASGKNILVQGTLPLDQKDIVRTFSIKDPSAFARSGLIQALREQGITLRLKEDLKLPPKGSFEKNPLAVWTSPPLSEYAKLILKVSHNLGADLAPMLLAVKHRERTFAEGLRQLAILSRKRSLSLPMSLSFSMAPAETPTA